MERGGGPKPPNEPGNGARPSRIPRLPMLSFCCLLTLLLRLLYTIYAMMQSSNIQDEVHGTWLVGSPIHKLFSHMTTYCQNRYNLKEHYRYL